LLKRLQEIIGSTDGELLIHRIDTSDLQKPSNVNEILDRIEMDHFSASIQYPYPNSAKVRDL